MDISENDKNNIFSDLNKLNQYLNALDERGLVLSLAAFSEEILGKMLETFMLDNKISKELIDGFNAPLGTFSSRIKACFSLGMINGSQYKDLEILRKVRNKFSHSWEMISLEDDDISKQIINLNFSRIDFEYPINNYDRIKKSISSLLIEMKVITKSIEDKNKGAKLIGTHINIGFNGSYEEQLNQIREITHDINTKLKSGDKKIISFTKHKARLLIERLPYVNFNHGDLDIFSAQLVDILELRYEILNVMGSDEYRVLSEEDKKRLRVNIFKDFVLNDKDKE